MSGLPELEPHCGSWIVCKDGYTFETWTRRVAERAAKTGWRVRTAAQYLADVNRAARGNEHV
jgi:hypothetical protein